MLDPKQFHGVDRWHNKAIDMICPHLERALKTGSPTVVNPFPTALSQSEVIEVAVRVCRQAGAAVLAGPGYGLTLVPLRSPAAAPAAQEREAAPARRRRRTALELAV
jgi:hypothetical protein